MTKNKIYVYHLDPGHGWLAVKRKELEDLGIASKITSCSYQKGKTVYLEEDCDMSLFLQAKGYTKENPCVSIKESYKEHTPLRNYPSYQYQNISNQK